MASLHYAKNTSKVNYLLIFVNGIGEELAVALLHLR